MLADKINSKSIFTQNVWVTPPKDRSVHIKELYTSMETQYIETFGSFSRDSAMSVTIPMNSGR